MVLYFQLVNTRMISKKVIDYFIDGNIFHEGSYKNSFKMASGYIIMTELDEVGS